MFHLKFTDGDLKANREGRLTDAQRKRVDTDLDTMKRHAKYMLLFMVVFFMALNGLNLMAKYNMTRDTTQLLADVAVLLGIVFTGAGLVYLFNAHLMPRRFAKGTIFTAEGVAYPASHRMMEVTIYKVALKNASGKTVLFQFQDADSFNYFKEGQAYRVYYLASPPPYALSAESLNERSAEETSNEDR